MKIEDNFLDQEKFDELQTFIVSDSFAWFYVDGIDYSIRESNGVLSFPVRGAVAIAVISEVASRTSLRQSVSVTFFATQIRHFSFIDLAPTCLQ